MKRAWVAALAAAGLVAPTALAAADLSDYVGYSIIANKTVEGYVDPDGKSDDSFEGCEHDRKIVFTDGTYLVCATYSYSYSYRPEAVILANGTSLVMIVNNNEYRMRRN